MTSHTTSGSESGDRRTRLWLRSGWLLTAFVLTGLAITLGHRFASPVAKSGEAKLHRPVTAADRQRSGEDWPHFLGPRHTGVSGETGLLQEWPDSGPPIIWEKDVGAGYSAPSILGHRLVLHHRVGDEEIVECMRADDGTSLWKSSYTSEFRDPYGYNNGPRCSPILTDKHCFTLGAEGKLLCLELETGTEVWSRELKQDFQLPDWFFGVGCSPILDGNRLIVLVGGQPNSGVVAFEADTGEIVWQAVGRETWDGAQTGWDSEPTYEWTGSEMVVSYSSPIIATIHGKRHLLCLMRQGLVSLDPSTGSENFHYWFRARVHESVNAARPVVIEDKILLSAAYRVGSALLQVKPDGRGVTELWRDSDNLLCHWSTPIPVEGFVYGFSGRHEREGELRCIDLATGKVAWASDGSDPVRGSVTYNQLTGQFVDSETGDPAPFPFYGRGSLIRTGERFIALGERGTLALIEIDSEELKELARVAYPQIHFPAWTAPVLSRKRLYLRCEDALICLDLASATQ